MKRNRIDRNCGSRAIDCLFKHKEVIEGRVKIAKSFNEMSILFPLLTLYTLAYLALMGYDLYRKWGGGKAGIFSSDLKNSEFSKVLPTPIRTRLKELLEKSCIKDHLLRCLLSSKISSQSS